MLKKAAIFPDFYKFLLSNIIEMYLDSKIEIFGKRLKKKFRNVCNPLLISPFWAKSFLTIFQVINVYSD